MYSSVSHIVPWTSCIRILHKSILYLRVLRPRVHWKPPGVAKPTSGLRGTKHLA